MPRTPDLKPDEFEITTVCPIGGCLAHHTFAFKKELLNNRKEFAAAKTRFFEQTKKTHNEGKHLLGSTA